MGRHCCGCTVEHLAQSLASLIQSGKKKTKKTLQTCQEFPADTALGKRLVLRSGAVYSPTSCGCGILWNTIVGLRTLARSLCGVLPKIEVALLSKLDAVTANHFWIDSKVTRCVMICPGCGELHLQLWSQQTLWVKDSAGTNMEVLAGVQCVGDFLERRAHWCYTTTLEHLAVLMLFAQFVQTLRLDDCWAGGMFLAASVWSKMTRQCCFSNPRGRCSWPACMLLHTSTHLESNSACFDPICFYHVLICRARSRQRSSIAPSLNCHELDWLALTAGWQT